jgi:hypothetical protein
MSDVTEAYVRRALEEDGIDGVLNFMLDWTLESDLDERWFAHQLRVKADEIGAASVEAAPKG